jgi:hypothetical protein
MSGMDNTLHSQLPTGWGNDPMTAFLETCRGNQLATFANKRSEVIDLTTIDDMFHKLLEGAINPKPFLPAGFLQRAHAAFLAGAGAAMSGQLYELHALLRVCLEQAGYAHYIRDDQPRWERWMSRHDSPDATKLVRKEFQHIKICEHLAAANADVGRAYTRLYDQAIDYGAHPNERGTSLSTTIENIEDGGKRFNTVYLHGDGLMMDFALKTTAQVGLCVLRIAQLIYPSRTQATGVQFQLGILCKRF